MSSRVLFFITIFSGFIFVAFSVEALNNSATATLTVANSVPVASNTAITNASPIVLTAGTTTTITATFTVTDNNGCEDIDSAATKTTAKFYRTGVTNGVACSNNDLNCYTMTCEQTALSCTAGGSDLDATYSCTAAVKYFADATDSGVYSADTWSLGAIPADNAGAATGNTSTTVEMGTMNGLDVTSSISYSSLALGADTGTTDQTTTVTNEGNRVIDTQVGGYGNAGGDTFSMKCTIGNIAVAYEKYSTSAAVAYASKTALKTNTGPDTVVMAIPKGNSSNTGNIYWGMGLPATGVGGSCTGHVVFTAVTNS